MEQSSPCSTDIPPCDAPGRFPAVFILAALMASIVFFARLPDPEGVLTIDSADFSTMEGYFPAESVRSLPHNWSTGDDSVRDQAWYRVDFQLDHQPTKSHALLVPSHRSTAAFSVNGTLIGDSGRDEKPLARNAMVPYLFVIPPALLVAGKNRLEIRLLADPPRHGFLDHLYLGPRAALSFNYNLRTLVFVSTPRVITTLVFLLSTFLWLLWLNRRQETSYGLFAAQCLVWSIFNLNTVVTEIPVSLRVWDFMVFASLTWTVVISVPFAHSFTHTSKQALDRLAIIYGVGITAVMALLPADQFYRIGNFLVMPANLALACYSVYRITHYALFSGLRHFRFLGAAGIIVVVFGLHDILVITGILGDRVLTVLHLSQIPVILAIGAILVERFAHSLNEVQTLNQNLEQRITEAEEKLERAFVQRRAMEKARVLHEERTRLIRDMHDGLGGQLMSILSLSEGEAPDNHRIAQMSRLALDDMRLMIASLNTADNDLPSLLGTIRERQRPWLEEAGITVHWQVDTIPEIPGFDPWMAVNVLRIVQEAVTNVLKHTQARNLTFSLRQADSPDGGWVILSINDDGHGDWNHRGSGMGLDNMRRRADAIGAEFNLSFNERGTSLTLSMPLTREPADARNDA